MTIRRRRRQAGPDKLAQARETLRSYWGATGPDRTGDPMRSVLRSLDLSQAEIVSLMDELPTHATGPVGDRAGKARRFLGRLMEGA